MRTTELFKAAKRAVAALDEHKEWHELKQAIADLDGEVKRAEAGAYPSLSEANDAIQRYDALVARNMQMQDDLRSKTKTITDLEEKHSATAHALEILEERFASCDARDKPVDDGGPARDITLRDWFAGMALQGFCSNQEYTTRTNIDASARDAFRTADAMLAARNGKESA